jgi:hypothetical protein
MGDLYSFTTDIAAAPFSRNATASARSPNGGQACFEKQLGDELLALGARITAVFMIQQTLLGTYCEPGDLPRRE